MFKIGKTSAFAAAATALAATAALALAAADSAPAQLFSGKELWSQDGRTLAQAPAWNAVVMNRKRSAKTHAHADWNELIMIQEGRATIVTATGLTGYTEETPGERRGGTMTGVVQRHEVGPGDVLMIPAGAPHELILPAGQATLRQLVVKTHR